MGKRTMHEIRAGDISATMSRKMMSRKDCAGSELLNTGRDYDVLAANLQATL